MSRTVDKFLLEEVANFLAENQHDLLQFGKRLDICTEKLLKIKETTLRKDNAAQYLNLLLEYSSNDLEQCLFDACNKCGIGSQYYDFLKSKKYLRKLMPSDCSITHVEGLSEPHRTYSLLLVIAKEFCQKLDAVTALSIYLEADASFIEEYKKVLFYIPTKKYMGEFATFDAYQEYENEAKIMAIEGQTCVVFYEMLKSACHYFTAPYFWERLWNVLVRFGYCKDIHNLARLHKFYDEVYHYSFYQTDAWCIKNLKNI